MSWQLNCDSYMCAQLSSLYPAWPQVPRLHIPVVSSSSGVRSHICRSMMGSPRISFTKDAIDLGCVRLQEGKTWVSIPCKLPTFWHFLTWNSPLAFNADHLKTFTLIISKHFIYESSYYQFAIYFIDTYCRIHMHVSICIDFFFHWKG